MPYYYSPFRKNYEQTAHNPTPVAKPCVFCDEAILAGQTLRTHTGTLIENEHYRWVVNWYPRAEAHTMLVPTRHLTAIAEETSEALIARQELLVRCITILQAAFPDSGVEVFLQTGKGSLSSIPHLHWHLVPTLPQHALTGFEKIGYFSAIEPAEAKVVMTPIEITIARDELLTLVANTCKTMEK